MVAAIGNRTFCHVESLLKTCMSLREHNTHTVINHIIYYIALLYKYYNM
jgi:hypothetical protein